MKNGWVTEYNEFDFIMSHYVDDILHNEYGPAVIKVIHDGVYWQLFKNDITDITKITDELHEENKKIFFWYLDNNEQLGQKTIGTKYFLNGEQLDYEDWEIIVRKYKIEKILQKTLFKKTFFGIKNGDSFR